MAGEAVATSEAGRLFDIAGTQPGTPAVLIIVSQLDRRAIHGFLEAGAAGAVPKDWCRRRMCTAIRTVAAGGTVLAEELHADVRHEIRRRALISRERLTLREREILVHLAEGLSAPQIAARLYLGTPTVKTTPSPPSTASSASQTGRPPWRRACGRAFCPERYAAGAPVSAHRLLAKRAPHVASRTAIRPASPNQTPRMPQSWSSASSATGT